MKIESSDLLRYLDALIERQSQEIDELVCTKPIPRATLARSRASLSRLRETRMHASKGVRTHDVDDAIKGMRSICWIN